MKTLPQVRTALDHEISKAQAVVAALLGIEADIDALISPPPVPVFRTGRGTYGATAYGASCYGGGPPD